MYVLRIVGTAVLCAVVIYSGFHLAAQRFQRSMKPEEQRRRRMPLPRRHAITVGRLAVPSCFAEERALDALALAWDAVAILETGWADEANRSSPPPRASC
jgi:hypothetical protein